jgi:quercetin dioxygenase-like cupin family protein
MDKKQIQAFKEYNSVKFTKRVVFKNGESVAFILNFMPGQELPPHKHPETAVYILVLEGNGTVTVNEEQTSLVKDDLISCDGNEQFSFKNTGSEPTSLYVVLSKIPDERYAQNM